MSAVRLEVVAVIPTEQPPLASFGADARRASNRAVKAAVDRFVHARASFFRVRHEVCLRPPAKLHVPRPEHVVGSVHI